MFNKAQKDMDDHLSVVDKWEDFLSALDNKNIIMAPFCGDPDWSVEFGFLLKYKKLYSKSDFFFIFRLLIQHKVWGEK